ncbi:MAG TPA: cytidine deaminase [Kofleriaceae bacterium]|nr:cytidine deaminase [Kofleriaceae bacterium]
MAALERAAREAQQRAYAPYSNFKVGAALLTGSGEIFTGANVENASYGLTVCAERTACITAALAGHRDVRAICVITDASPPASPCGMCRQTLLEFTPDPSKVRVLALGPDGARDEWTVAELIPHGFTGKQLDTAAPAPAPKPARKPAKRP